MRAATRSNRVAGRGRLVAWLASVAAVALIVTMAVISDGFDSRETPREDPSVWVERTAGQYARVNTDTAEIDTVRVVENPSGVVQSGGMSLLLTQGLGRAWPINPSAPADVRTSDPRGSDAESDGSTPEPAGTQELAADAALPVAQQDQSSAEAMVTPEGTRQVIAAGDFVLFLTENGEAHLSKMSTAGAAGAAGTAGAAGAPGAPGAAGNAAVGASAVLRSPAMLDDIVLLDPFAESREASDGDRNDDSNGDSDTRNDDGNSNENDGGAGDAPTRYVADAAAIDERGIVAVYSSAEQAVRWYDGVTARWRSEVAEVPAGVPAGAQLALVGGSWVLFDEVSGTLWHQEYATPVTLDLLGAARLQASSAVSTDALIADEGGLWRVTSDGESERIAQATGFASQPRFVDGEPIAAWISATEARLWTPDGGEVALDLDAAVEDLSTPDLEIRSNGSRALIVERRSGMIWAVPSGTLIPVEQWSLVDPPKEETGTVVTQDVTDQEPPVAVNDSFGVRPGEPTLLPVLLNDYDPNRKDVLTVLPDGLGDGLRDDFGEIELTSDRQHVLVRPSALATGSTTFTYRITDGASVSAPANVTLTVAADTVNTAPEWCAVEGCQRNWPSPELAPGGTLIMPVLEGWVDAEGDPIMLKSARLVDQADTLRALVTADGKLALRHHDANAEAADAVVRVTVADATGLTTERDLRVRVRSGAAIEFASAAATVMMGEATMLRPLERVTGGSGSFALTDAAVQQGSLNVTHHAGRGIAEVQGSEPGEALVAVTVRDTVTEQETSGIIRVTVIDARTSFGIPPLRAFVRPLADSTVDVFSAIPGANSRALTVRAATVNDGQLRADVIEHARVRVSGATVDGQPGRIGSVDVVIAEGVTTSHGRLTVFQVEEGMGGAIAVPDTATVRAGSVVDVPVLDNDVAPPGERLVLHPEIGSPGAAGELAFASGSNVRYLAPKTPGTYTLHYTTSGASSPELSDVGEVRVTVLPTDANRDPLPATVTVRISPGERVNTVVPLSGVDPDGDRVRLVSVEAPDDPQLSANMLPRSTSVQIDASTAVQQGTSEVAYLVRDAFGGEAAGILRIIVTEPDAGGGAPVTYSDYARLAAGADRPAVVRPLDNDLDPSGGALELVSVVPNVPGGASSPRYRELSDRLDLSELSAGVVRVHGGDLGTESYVYTVRSAKSKSTTDGLIVVQVSERTGQQAPAVSDTVLSVRDRTDFARLGVDVITDRVRWASGDVSTLKLSLWQGASGSYRVEGARIFGTYRAEGDLVPFRLAGTDATGAEVETFGFLVIPPLDELRLSLRSDVAPVTVNENKSVDVRIADLLDVGRADEVVLEQSAFAVQRQQATCRAINETTIRYSAGREGPWSDHCTIRVRLAEQRTSTVLPIPISIVPDAPVVQLNPLTRTISPGDTEQINLLDMVQWQGGREGDLSQLRWQVSGGGASFQVTTTANEVRAVALAGAVPGAQEALNVSVRGSGDSQALLTLRVGEAAAATPRGGTVSMQCTVGSPCITPVIGAPGQVDPFAGKAGGGLELVSVDDHGCQYGTLTASGESVQASWSDTRGPGGKCTASFVVKDAQNRLGTGAIEFDALGVPRAPSSIALVAADRSRVTLLVQLGDAANAHPAMTGVVIEMDGGEQVGSCSAEGGAYRCTVDGLTMGETHTFAARAVNAIGESDATTPVRGWAYASPAPPKVTEVVQTGATTTSSGDMRFVIDANDPSTDVLRVSMGGKTETVRASAGEAHLTGVPAGASVAWTVTPISRFQPPTDSGGNEGSAVNGVAAVSALPAVTVSATSAAGSDKVEVMVTASPNGAGDVEVGFAVAGQACNANTPVARGDSYRNTFTHSGTRHTELQVVGCARNEWGAAPQQATATVLIGGALPPLQFSSGYRISTVPTQSGLDWQWTTLAQAPTVSNQAPGATVTYSTGATVVPQVNTSVQAWQCLNSHPDNCSEPVEVPRFGAAAARVTWSGLCPADPTRAREEFTVVGSAPGSFEVTADSASDELHFAWIDGRDWESLIIACP